jgi:hypothetical protein
MIFPKERMSLLRVRDDILRHSSAKIKRESVIGQSPGLTQVSSVEQARSFPSPARLSR